MCHRHRPPDSRVLKFNGGFFVLSIFKLNKKRRGVGVAAFSSTKLKFRAPL